MAKQDFYAMYMPQAQAAAAELNVPAEAILNQWGLETGWGKSVIPGTNNLGNIKSTNGKGIYATDNMTGSRDPYRQYSTPDEFVQDYTRLIKSRYPNAVGSKDALAFGTALKAGGYAEDQNYARKVAGMPVESTSNSALPNARATYDRRDPAQVYQFMLDNQQDIPVQQLSPEQRAALVDDRQRQAAMLPLSIGAALSGDKRVRALGSQMYNNAIGAQGAQKLGDYGWMTAEGDMVENPLRAADRQEGRRDRALTLAVQASKASQAPAGYTWVQGPNGEPQLTFIPGGPGDPKVKDENRQPTEDERKSAGYALRIDQGLGEIKRLTEKDPKSAKQGVFQRGLSMLPVIGTDASNAMTSGNRQQVEAAQLDMLDAALTLNTGAAYTKEQLQGLSKSYFPQIGDDAETVAGKQKRLDNLIETARMRAGRMNKNPQVSGNAGGNPNDPLGLLGGK